jgi:hypothetical protein
MGRFRGNKYKNRFVRVLADDTVIDHVAGDERGEFFRSAAEARRFVYLRQLERAGEIALLQRQPPFELYGFSPVTGELVRFGRYVGDFMYVRGGQVVVEDVKGMRTDEYELKKQLMLYLYGIAILETK